MRKDFENVVNNVINPMVKFYGLSRLDDEIARAFVEDLGVYSEEVLKAAWKTVRQTVKAKPTLAHFVEAIKSDKEIKSGALPVFNGTEKDKKHGMDYAKAAQEMETPVGQYALKNGVGRDVWLRAAEGKKVADADIPKFVSQKMEGVRLMRDFPDKKFPAYDALVKLQAKMAHQEEWLKSKYLRFA